MSCLEFFKVDSSMVNVANNVKFGRHSSIDTTENVSRVIITFAIVLEGMSSFEFELPTFIIGNAEAMMQIHFL